MNDTVRSTPLRRIIITCLLLVLSWYEAGKAAAQSNGEIEACIDSAKRGFLPLAADRSERFLGKVEEDTARCRGGEKAVRYRHPPWVDWQNYYGAGDGASLKEGRKAVTVLGKHIFPNGRGLDGALIDLEYQRIDLIRFNLFDQNTYQEYVTGRDQRPGPVLKQWEAMRVPATNKYYHEVGGEGRQVCRGELITHRTLTGICNDVINPLMGSTGMPFSRNMEFAATFPELGLNELIKNRHGDRLGIFKPDPQLISRKLLTREQANEERCNHGLGLPGLSPEADCDYLKAPFFNVMAAFWIQFMTHDWFSHTREGRNSPELRPAGCLSEEARTRGCRPDDRYEPSLYLDRSSAQSFDYQGQAHVQRAPMTTGNLVTAWWDGSQLYGYDDRSLRRVQRNPRDPAKLLIYNSYLPLLPDCDPEAPDCPVEPQWKGQEAAAFPDNWDIGMSFFHNLFTREHNFFIDRFRELQTRTPDDDSGLRDPADPNKVISYKEVDDERLFQVARLVVAAEIAKIHTIEWTTQLLYNEPLYQAMNSNWYGLFNLQEDRVSMILRRIFNKDENLFGRLSDRLAGLFSTSTKAEKANTAYSVLASGGGIFGLGSKKPKGLLWWSRDSWDLRKVEEDVNGGTNHFGVPFSFPEEFPSVYRLHPLVPDLIEFRKISEPNVIQLKIPVLETIRGKATDHMRQRGIDNWALSMGRQRLGLLHLHNMPMFLQNLPMPHLNSATRKLDIAALDIIRDRERGIPKFNEFRRQIGLKTLAGFDDFVDQRLDKDNPWRKKQEAAIAQLREIYGTHTCDAQKVISTAQRNPDGTFINDCLGHPDGSVVDNIEDVDNVVGMLAEYTRPHGFAISETQFHIFIINASRRLFSDRFFTSSFRPEFYSRLGYDWVLNNGPQGECPYDLSTLVDGSKACLEPEKSNGHTIAVSPLKRILLRNIPELKNELMSVKNAFDPWARDRGSYYSLQWKPRPGAEADPAFAQP